MGIRSARARLGVVCLAMLSIAGARSRASACAICGCGDPTLTAVGVEKPYKNRLRLTLEERFGGSSNGAGDELVRRLVSHTILGVSYTPHPRITLVAFLPFFDSHLTGPGEPQAHIAGLGDLEMQARVVVARDRAFAPHHLLWLIAGVKAPTGPRLYDDAGYPYFPDDQPGSGAWDPVGGATYAWFGGSVTLYTSLLYRYTTFGRDGTAKYRFGSTLHSQTVAQIQPFSWLALQLGADFRQSWADQLSNGAASPNTGGFVAALAPGVLINPWRDLLIRVAVEVPVIQALYGTQSVTPQGILSISYDIH